MADLDLENLAYYYAREASPELGHRFLTAAHDTFALLATNPGIGWRPQLMHPKLEFARFFRVRRFEKVLILYLVIHNGVDILRVAHGSRNLQTLFRQNWLM